MIHHLFDLQQDIHFATLLSKLRDISEINMSLDIGRKYNFGRPPKQERIFGMYYMDMFTLKNKKTIFNDS